MSWLVLHYQCVDRVHPASPRQNQEHCFHKKVPVWKVQIQPRPDNLACWPTHQDFWNIKSVREYQTKKRTWEQIIRRSGLTELYDLLKGHRAQKKLCICVDMTQKMKLSNPSQHILNYFPPAHCRHRKNWKWNRTEGETKVLLCGRMYDESCKPLHKAREGTTRTTVGLYDWQSSNSPHQAHY